MEDGRPLITHDNEERFSLGGAAHEPSAGAPKPGAAPVSEKRIGLSRSPRRRAMGVEWRWPFCWSAIGAFGVAVWRHSLRQPSLRAARIDRSLTI